MITNSLILNLIAILFFLVSFFTNSNSIFTICGWVFFTASLVVRLQEKEDKKKEHTKTQVFNNGYSVGDIYYFKKDFNYKNVLYLKKERFSEDICDYETFKSWCERGILTKK